MSADHESSTRAVVGPEQHHQHHEILSLNDILSNEFYMQYFLNYLANRNCQSLLLFLVDVRQYRQAIGHRCDLILQVRVYT